MAKVIAFTVEVNGVQNAIRNQDDLKKAVAEVNKVFQTADFGSEKYERAAKELAVLQNAQTKLRDQSRQLRTELTAQEQAAEGVEGAYRKLNAQLTTSRNRLKDLAAAGQDNTQEFRDLQKEVTELDTKLKGIDANAGQFQRNVGNYSSAFAGLGGIDLAAFTSVPGAIAAAGTAAVAATQYVFELSEEFRNLRGEIQTLTGATGGELDQFTIQVASIAETFQQDQDEIIRAANNAAKTLNISFGEALDRISEGFIAGSNAQGQFLDSVSEYGTFFQEAGLSADQFFATLNQSATEGIFSDKGVDVVKEVTLRLRELPQATQDALSAIGLQSEDIRKQIAEEGIGAAIATVSERLGQLRADSPEVGQAIADIFGGPGEDAGLGFIISLQNINKETGSLIDQNNEYQLQQQRILQVNKEFAAVQNEIAKELGGTGASLQTVGTQLKTFFLELLLQSIRQIQSFIAIYKPLYDAFVELAKVLGLVDESGRRTESMQKALNVAFQISLLPLKLVVAAVTGLVKAYTFVVEKGQDFLTFLGIIEKRQQGTAKANKEVVNGLLQYVTSTRKATDENKKLDAEVKKSTKSIEDFDKKTKSAAVAADGFAKNSIAALRKEVQSLNTQIEQAAPGDQAGLLQKLLQAEKALEDAENFRLKLREIATRSAEDIRQIQSVATLQPAGQVQSQTGVVENAETEAAELQAIREQSERNRLELIKQTNEQIIAEQKLFIDQFAEVQELLFGSIGSVIQSLSDTSQSITDSQIASLETRYNREIELAEGNKDRQEALAKELAEKRAAIEKEEFERQKRYRVAAAFASLAEGIINILAAPTTIPDPFGTLFKAFRIGVLTTTTTAQIAAINRQKAERGLLIKQLAKGDLIGGKLRGAAHSDASGGVPVTIRGVPVMAEGGEFLDVDEYGGVAVVNKRSTAVFEKSLKGILGKTFPGKRALLSDINSYKNFGVPYMAQGALLKPNVKSVVFRGSGITAEMQVVAISESSIESMAQRNAQAVEAATERGIRTGLYEANREYERNTRRDQRLGLL